MRTQQGAGQKAGGITVPLMCESVSVLLSYYLLGAACFAGLMLLLAGGLVFWVWRSGGGE